MAAKLKHGLGKGLGALIPQVDLAKEKMKNDLQNEQVESGSGYVTLIDIDKIRTNPYQPRTDFDDQALEDLKNSILEHGLISPITVRKSINGYELIAGERRMRAHILAKLKKIPAYILDVDGDTNMLSLALIENVQRENLNAIEIAFGYRRLIDECKFTQEQVAEKIGKDRTTVTNFLRLLRLPENLQELVRKRQLSMGHARSIVGLSDQTKMVWVGKEVVEKHLSVRDTEALVKKVESGAVNFTSNDKKPKSKNVVSEETLIVLNEISDKLRKAYGTQVKITPKSKESGMIEFEFYSSDDLERLTDLMMNNIE